ncbi:MAG: uL15 family ribosomal protein, partial [Mucispirillum sp.]|nr:uL15 family ribosomal protein [Mucispirillum sp.]
SGFNNARFARVYEIGNLSDIEERFETGEIVNAENLKARRLVHCNEDGIKILGNGELTKKLDFVVDKVSKSAEEKIKQAGGEIKLIEKVKYVAQKNK